MTQLTAAELLIRSRVDQYISSRDHESALFWCERLNAERTSDESRLLLAQCYLHANHAAKAYAVLHHHVCDQNRYLLAFAAFNIGRYRDAEVALLGAECKLDDSFAYGALGLNLLGKVMLKQNRRAKAIECYRKSLDIDSCLWSSFDALCKLGALEVSDTVFYIPTAITTVDPSALSRPSDCLYTPARSGTVMTSLSFQTPASKSTPLDCSSSYHSSMFETPMDVTPTIDHNLHTPAAIDMAKKMPPPIAHIPCRAARETRIMTRSERLSFSSVSEQHQERPENERSLRSNVRARRSARLEKMKERNLRKPLSTTTFRDENKVLSEEGKVIPEKIVDSLEKSIALIAQGHYHLLQYECAEAIQAFKYLPQKHFNTSRVLIDVARCYFEMVNYEKAVEMFEIARNIEPHSLRGFEIYSTALWQLKKETRLSYLAQHCVAVDRMCPETWVVVGNCFSLQKEHDTALKFFQRAIQIDENFAYAYTLSAHEYVANEDFDKAIAGYRHAIRNDDRHYNAWYGLGHIYYRQEKYDLAAYHFQRAIKINSRSSVLECYLGMVLHANQQYRDALLVLDRSCELEPSNLLPKFQKANVYCQLQQYDLALAELQDVQDLAPREASVHFLTGKIYRKTGNLDKALMHFSSCLDLDPKDKNLVKATIDKLHILVEQGSQSDEDF